MNEENQITVNNIKQKLGWAIRSLEKIKNSNHSKLEIQDNFWSFLTAFKQSWFYYNHLIVLKNPNLTSKQRNKVGISIIENWKNSSLTDYEKFSWDSLQKIRDYDTHNEPMMPEIGEREGVLATETGAILIDDMGNCLSMGLVTIYYVNFEGVELNIIDLATNGITLIGKLIEYVSQLT